MASPQREVPSVTAASQHCHCVSGAELRGGTNGKQDDDGGGGGDDDDDDDILVSLLGCDYYWGRCCTASSLLPQCLH